MRTFEDYSDEGDRSSVTRVVVQVILVLALLGGVFVGYRALSSSSAARQPPFSGSASPGESLATTSTIDAGVGSVVATVPVASGKGAEDPSTTVDVGQEAPIPASSILTATTSAASAVSSTTVSSTVSYATEPDGRPSPVLAVFDVDTITLVGAVPSQAAKDRLQSLAAANSKTPATVNNFLTIDPTVPVGIGVRVIELTSSRFDEGKSDIVPGSDHAKEFDRIGAIMNALPNTTVLVIGHADQVGSPDANFALSDARARAVVTYLVSTGIAPSRLASRAVGESDLLSLRSDATALALNRRTEFVVYGLLLGA